MMIMLYAIAGVFAMLLLTTMAFSNNWLATGIRGTIRQGVLGIVFLAPVALVLTIIGVAVYAFVASVLQVVELTR